MHELTHVFTKSPNAGVYGHREMARAARAAANLRGIDVEKEIKVTKDKNLEFPTEDKYGTKTDYDEALSNYFNNVLRYACRRVKL